MAVDDLSKLQTEGRNSRTTNIDTLPALELCRVINEEDSTVANAVEQCLPIIAAAIDATAPRIRRGGRLIYVGAGTSGRLGILDASEIPPTFSASSEKFVGIIAGGEAAIRDAQEGAEDDVTQAIMDLQALNLNPDQDTLLGIAASGRTPYVVSCLKFAKDLGCLTIGITCCYPSIMSDCGHVDHIISAITGPEVITGSTRLKAGTGTKMVLNMLSTGIMIKVGKTYGNMMVDLKATNVKLEQRSRNIIRSIEPAAFDFTDEELDSRIKSCDGSVKLALMTLMTGLEKEDCKWHLERARGVLSKALQGRQAKVISAEKINGMQTINDDSKPERLVLCIDGGGTKCAVAVANEAGEIGKGEAGPCNVTDVSVEEMAKVVTLATQRALEKLYPSRDCTNWYLQRSIYQFSTLRAGIAGYDRPGLAPSVEIALGRLFNIPKGTNLHITNDIDLLASAMMKHSGLRTGIVLLAGTGSVAMSYEIKTGVPVRTARSGGWGWILGDGGSGFDLGRKGVQATLSALEEARISTSSRDPATKGVLKPFHLDIMKSLGVPEEWITFDVLSHILKENSESFDDLKSKIAGVALTVLNAASSDLEAIQIVHSGAEALVSILFTLVRYACVTPEKSVLILAGGLMKTQMYRGVVLQKLRREGVHFPIVEIIEDAAIFGVQSLKTLA